MLSAGFGAADVGGLTLAVNSTSRVGPAGFGAASLAGGSNRVAVTQFGSFQSSDRFGRPGAVQGLAPT